MINPVTNLLYAKVNFVKQNNMPLQSNSKPVLYKSPSFGNLITDYMNNLAVINSAKVEKLQTPARENYHNNLRTLLTNNEAKILAIIPRTFNAKDLNGNEYIDSNETHGTFLNAIERLDEIKSQGFNTLHILPVHPTGKQKAMGTAGSLYSPQDMLTIDPNLADKNDPRSVKEQFKAFIDECHARNIKVMIDLPSCASYDMFLREPKLMAKERDGLAKTPQGWNDIRMFQPWEDEGKRTLNPELLELHKKYVDMCLELGADGIRADVARAKPVEFWDVIIPYSRMKNPEFGWLAETYTYEDASAQANMAYDRPEDSLRSGFDCIYGQYHIFHEWPDASTFMNYVKEQLNMSYNLPKGKSLIGSFATHDDISPMYHGGSDYCNLTMGLQVTLPMLNPYIVDGYQSGDYYKYSYKDKINPETQTDNKEMTVHPGRLDIFNYSRKPGGNNPEIGDFMKSAFELKDKYADIINKGTFIELNKKGDKTDQIIAFARHYKGKTLLVLANKNVNRPVSCTVNVPGLQNNEPLNNLLPSYGQKSIIQAANNKIHAQIGPARIHVFEINTPDIENYTNKIYRQNL